MIEETTQQTQPEEAPRNVQQAMLRGAAQRCPACGEGRLYDSFLKVQDACPKCGEELHHHRADDAPPYFTMLITGHVVVAALLVVETELQPPLWVHAAIWGPLIILMSLSLLPRIKGALVGLQWALRMHGFSGQPDEVALEPQARITPS